MITLPNVPPSELVIDQLKSLNDGVRSLAFRCGKDAICAYLASKVHLTLHLPYQFLIPNLEFAGESLQHYEQRWGVTFNRIPHPSLYRMLAYLRIRRRALTGCVADRHHRFVCLPPFR